MSRHDSRDETTPTLGGHLNRKQVTPDRMPEPARSLVGLVAPDVLSIAVEIYNTAADPRTGEPRRPDTHAAACDQAFEAAWTSAQEDCAVAADRSDAEYLAAADSALAAAHEALDLTEQADAVLDRTVPAPGGAQLTRRRVAEQHLADERLARARADDGDSRHLQAPIGRPIVALGAGVYGLLDLFLLYFPILNLSFTVDEPGDVLRWLIGLVLAVGQALALEQALQRYRSAERAGTDLRDSFGDFNRSVDRQPEAPPALTDLDAADQRFRRAQRFLLTMAVITAVLAAWRIAVLTRDAGLSVPDGALFGSGIGLTLGMLVLLLGAQLCRGNALGDRLDQGAAVVEETDRIRRADAEAAAEVRRTGLDALEEARKQRAGGDEIRAAVVGAYWDGMQRAAVWLGVGRPPAPGQDGQRIRPLPVLIDAADRVDRAEHALDRVGRWLHDAAGAAHPEVDTAGAAEDSGRELTARPADPFGARDRGVLVGRRSVIHHARIEVPRPPGEPRWLITAGAALTVGAAYLAAWTAAGPLG